MSMFKFFNRIRCAAVGVVLLLGAATLSAQTHYQPHIWIGGRAGVSMAKIDLSPSVPQGWLMGSTGAVTFRFSEEKLFGVVAELGWATRGWKENFEEAPLSYSRSLTYINLPIMTQINFGSNRCKCFINLGPEFGYMLTSSISANFDYNDLSSVTTWPERERMKEQLAMPISNKFDYGITAGVGGEFYVVPRHSVSLEVRYYFGLGNVFPSTKADTFSASRCTSLELTLGYNFLLK